MTERLRQIIYRTASASTKHADKHGQARKLQGDRSETSPRNTTHKEYRGATKISEYQTEKALQQAKASSSSAATPGTSDWTRPGAETKTRGYLEKKSTSTRKPSNEKRSTSCERNNSYATMGFSEDSRKEGKYAKTKTSQRSSTVPKAIEPVFAKKRGCGENCSSPLKGTNASPRHSTSSSRATGAKTSLVTVPPKPSAPKSNATLSLDIATHHALPRSEGAGDERGQNVGVLAGAVYINNAQIFMGQPKK